MDDLEQKALIYVLFEKLKTLHHQKNAFWEVLLAVKSADPHLDVDGLVELALAAPDIKAKTDRYFSGSEKWIPPIPPVDFDEALRTWLEQWRPDNGEIN